MTLDLKYEQSLIRPRATLLLGNEQSRNMQAPRLEGENEQPSTGEYIKLHLEKEQPLVLRSEPVHLLRGVQSDILALEARLRLVRT